MIALMLAVVQALTFSLTISRDSKTATLRYPVGVVSLQVCVSVAGKTKGEAPWESESCWEPRREIDKDGHPFSPTERHDLRPGALRAQATLTIYEDGHRYTMRTPVIQVRPEEGTGDGFE